MALRHYCAVGELSEVQKLYREVSDSYHGDWEPIWMDMIDSQDFEGNSALFLASRGGHLEIVQFLVEQHPFGTSPTVNKKGENAVIIALKNNYFEIANLLAAHFLEEAAWYGDAKIVRDMLAVVSVQTAKDQALIVAFNSLVGVRKNPNYDEHDGSLTMYSCRGQEFAELFRKGNREEVIRLLIDQGADAESAWDNCRIQVR